MSILINSFLLPDSSRTPHGAAPGDWNTRACIFGTKEGLVGVYLQYDITSILRNRVSLYSPSDVGLATTIADFSTPQAWIAGYSAFHDGLIGVNQGAGFGTGTVQCMDLRTGFYRDIGLINGANVGIFNHNELVALAFDGTYLHYLENTSGLVHVYDMANNVRIRTYMSPFGTRSSSMAYDGAGAMWFGSGLGQSNHVAKVVVGTGGAQVEGTILQVARFEDYNTDGSNANLWTLVGWSNQNLMVNRRGRNDVRRYEVRGEPTRVIVSPNPARVPADGATQSSVEVAVLDDIGMVIPGASVTLSIDNTPSSVSTTNDIPKLTQNNDVSGYIASGSSELSGATQAYRAFDRDHMSQWAANNVVSWVQIQLPAPKIFGAMLLGARGGTTDINQTPRDFTIQGSNDGIAWTDLLVVTNQTGWGYAERRYFAFSNSTAYSYYRLSVQAGNGASVAVVGDIEFLVYTPPNPAATPHGSITGGATKNTNASGKATFTYQSGVTTGFDYLTATVTY